MTTHSQQDKIWAEKIDAIFDLEWLQPGMILDRKGVMFKWNDDFLKDTTQSIKQLLVEARLDELENLDTHRYYGKDYQESMDELAVYKENRIKELKERTHE